VALQHIVEVTVAGLGYDLVEIERSVGGLLRITIDLLPEAAAAVEALTGAPFITVEDCEKVNRQLLFALEVDGIDYKRMEVSSPGIDRPLRHAKDFERFMGSIIDVTLKAPIGSMGQDTTVHANRKKFRGTLEKAAAENTAAVWQIVWRDEPKIKPGQKISKNRVPLPLQALGFTLDEVREARLAPIVDFKGKGASALPQAE